jgi:hypothetical protein
MYKNKVKLEFWAGNPSVDLVNGEITYLPFSDKSSLSKELEYHELQGSKYLCCPNVPIHMSVIEFCEFISPEGSVFTKDISHIRVLKGPDQNSYIIALKMQTKTSAIEFVSHFHNKQFSFFEPDLCQLAILSDAYIENSVHVFLEA